MKRLGILLTVVAIAVNAMAQLKMPTADVKGDLSKYKFAYVVPTSSMTSNSGTNDGPTKTVNPSEVISGYLIKQGFTLIPSIDPEFAEETLVISYGHTGRRVLSLFAYASGIIIQVTDAKTHELIATYEAEGCGMDETEDIYQALYSALQLFSYSLNPEIIAELEHVQKNNILVRLRNRTYLPVKYILLRLTYYFNDELVYEQMTPLNVAIDAGYNISKMIKRDKVARDKKYQIKVDVISYN